MNVLYGLPNELVDAIYAYDGRYRNNFDKCVNELYVATEDQNIILSSVKIFKTYSAKKLSSMECIFRKPFYQFILTRIKRTRRL